MGIFKPSELIQFLDSLGISAQKRLSQNFLIDGNIIAKIISAASIRPNDLVIEIGPGPGALTEALLAAGAKVIAIEKDRILAKALERLQTNDKRLTVFEQDILEFDLKAFLGSHLDPGIKAKVAANLPYHLTTPIITSLVPLHERLESLTLMVQKEVADRFTAETGTSEYSSITLFLKYHAHVETCFTIEPTCFFPKPKVRSAVVQFHLKAPEQKMPEAFFSMMRAAFQQRRKMLRGSLRKFFHPQQIETCLSSIGMNPLSRPEQLSLKNFILLFQRLSQI